MPRKLFGGAPVTVFNNRTMKVLEKALDGASAKQKAIAHNIANVNTHGFKSFEVSFKEQLRNALGHSDKLTLKATDHRHITNKIDINELVPQVTRNNTTSARADGNNVDIDKEMTELAKNTIYNSAAITQLNKKLAILRYVISEGRR
jgi:flagellar basal-body rod protein FlgB